MKLDFIILKRSASTSVFKYVKKLYGIDISEYSFYTWFKTKKIVLKTRKNNSSELKLGRCLEYTQQKLLLIITLCALICFHEN